MLKEYPLFNDHPPKFSYKGYIRILDNISNELFWIEKRARLSRIYLWYKQIVKICPQDSIKENFKYAQMMFQQEQYYTNRPFTVPLKPISEPVMQDWMMFPSLKIFN